MGSAETTPSFLATGDLAKTTPCLDFSSPPITEGTSLISFFSPQWLSSR